MIRTLPVALLACAAVTLRALGAPAAQPPHLAAATRSAIERSESFWQRVQEEPPTKVSSRDLFGYALVLSEANQHLDRLDRLLEVAGRMRDADPANRTYGNFRWKWVDAGVLDWNAVEFCMQMGTVAWIRHRERLPETTRARLRELLEFSVEGCLRHRVPASYTNISLMNAANLILLGENLGNPKAADEGYRRLDQIVLYTWHAGIHEYGSPTYYGTDLDDLVVLERFCKRDTGKQTARALLELFWTDLAANWFAPAQKLAGARSRDYDYLRGLGYLDTAMWANGWLADEKTQGSAGALVHLLSDWRPAAELKQQNETQYPRLVRQSWGEAQFESRTHYVMRNVTLGSAGANYGNMDLPLSVDFAGARRSVRCYFIPDGRHDPYGKLKIPAGGGHDKTLHLRPFWAATQAKRDAVGLVVYRDKEVPADTETLESHWVMPLENDGVWIGEERVAPKPDETFERQVAPGQAVFVRKGTAAMGVKVLWARDRTGGQAPVRLVYEANEWGAMRLTVVHQDRRGVQPAAPKAGAAFWVRIADDLDGPAFAAWRNAFAAAEGEAGATKERVAVRVAGTDGAVAVEAAEPFQGASVLEPPPYRGVLELNGEEVGRPLLEALPVVVAEKEELANLKPIPLSPEGTAWEAEAGVVRGPMARGDDGDASGGKFVWMPGEAGGKGGGSGSASWLLQIPDSGVYYLWGRVLAPTPEDDSFYVRLFTDAAELVGRTDWPTGTRAEWSWVPAALGGGKESTPLALPAGEVTLQLLVREDGTRIDRLFLSQDPKAKPR
jgi:hypothetical protein